MPPAIPRGICIEDYRNHTLLRFQNGECMKPQYPNIDHYLRDPHQCIQIPAFRPPALNTQHFRDFLARMPVAVFTSDARLECAVPLNNDWALPLDIPPIPEEMDTNQDIPRLDPRLDPALWRRRQQYPNATAYCLPRTTQCVTGRPSQGTVHLTRECEGPASGWRQDLASPKYLL